MIGFWYHITNIGVSSTMIFTEKRKIRTLNALALISLVLSILHGALLYSYLLPQAGIRKLIIPALFPFGFSIVFLLHRYRQFVFARYYFITFSALLILVFSLKFGYTGIEYCLLPLLVLSFLFFEKALSLTYSVITIALCFLFAMRQNEFNANFYQFREMNDLYLPYMLAVFILLSVITYLFRKEFLDYQKLLEESNNSLSQKNMLLEEKENALTSALSDKEFLMKEIHHRVKNNLATVCGLINLESYNYSSPEIKQILETIRSRISTIGLIHENLYRSSDMQSINLEVYLDGLIQSLYYGLGLQTKNIFIEKKLIPLLINSDKAQNIGMLVCELISNSVKYAFDNQDNGQISIEVERLPNKGFTLNISDNGKGFDPNFDWKNTDSLGYQIIDALCQNLDAELSISDNQPHGARVSIRFY